ncbi:MAG: geranylgeranyl reductase family protein [Candidatus Hodarchaeales archaeon]|jgi:geranylgeranyl reductase family protein
MVNYDVIIVGAGTGGSITAAALASKGIRVALLDKHPKEKIGVKVCGDATSIGHFNRIAPIVKIDPPHGEELHQKVKGAWLYSPDREVKFELVEEGGTGIIIDRFKLGMRILNNAIDYGAELLDSTLVRKPIIDHDQITGVECRTKDKKLQDMSAKVTVDASGIGAILRKKLNPEKTFMDLELAPKDVCNCYREVRDVQSEIDSPEFIRISFDQELCPGGYLWEFPRGPYSMNSGLGVMRMNKLNAHTQFNKYLERENELYQDSKLIHGGGGLVPLRRPQDNLVWNGFLLVGDSGTQVKPTDGGGIGISINAGAMAGKVITEALENDDVSMNSLWDYNVQFMATIAAVNAPLAIMKDFIIPLPSPIINTVFHNKIVEGGDLLYGNATGEISGGIFKTLQRAYRGKRILRTLLKFRSVLKKMDIARKLYENYPKTPEAFLTWRNSILKLYGDVN